MSNNPSPKKLREWQERAALKDSIVPQFFEVFTNKVIIDCGNCYKNFQRPLIPNLNEPTFRCPDCNARNWVPVRFDRR